MDFFQIDADNFEWINGNKDDPEDLCLHGPVTVTIGNRKLAYDATVSASALYFLKTITEDHIINEDNQMLPCCGHFLIPNKELTEVCISGCNKGIDWTVLHRDGWIEIILEDGETKFVDPDTYKKEVFAFADKVERFYLSCSPKKFPEDEFVINGYTAFWNEWHRRRNAE